MHAADVTQTVHYLLLKTGMVVSRIHRNLRLRLFYLISLHQHKQVEWCDGVPKEKAQCIEVYIVKSRTFIPHGFQNICHLLQASLIAALPDTQHLSMAFFLS